jgi:hypothetical protein
VKIRRDMDLINEMMRVAGWGVASSRFGLIESK